VRVCACACVCVCVHVKFNADNSVAVRMLSIFFSA